MTGENEVFDQCILIQPSDVGSIPTAPTNHSFSQQQLSDLSRRQKAAIRASRVAPMAQPSVPSRYTCVLPPTRRGSKSSQERRVKPSLSGLCTNLKNLRNKSCSWTAVDLNDHIKRIFEIILDGLLWKRCSKQCRRRRAISPSSNRRCGCHDARLRRQRNSIRVRSRCCRMRPTWGGRSEMSAHRPHSGRSGRTFRQLQPGICCAMYCPSGLKKEEAVAS